MPSPTCTINGSPSAGGVNVAAGSTVTIALASSADVNSWSISCTGTDENNVSATINAGLVINSSAKTAVFTAPLAGSALLFTSIVNGGLDVNGDAQATYTAKFGVYVLTAGNVRVGAFSETTEGDASFGWTSKYNAALRGAVPPVVPSGYAIHFVSATGVSISSGANSPEGAVTAPVSSLFLRTDGSTNTSLYVKTSGAGNTGWTGK